MTRLSALLLLFSSLPPACAQATGMGVVLKDPTPRDPDPHDALTAHHPVDETLKRQAALRTEQQKEILAECNQILIAAHDLRSKLLQPATASTQPTNMALTAKIADLAHKVQQGELGGTAPPLPAAVTPAPLTSAAPEDAPGQIATDTRRLYQLSTELKLALIATPAGSISLSVARKAAEIEALAHGLSQRMKN